MKLARYMSVNRYKNLLSTRTLFFPRYDNLGDKFEGSLGYVDQRRLEHELIDQLLSGNIPLKTVAENTLESLEPMLYHSFLKNFTFASCWHSSTGESFLMWQVYAKKGIMVKSDLSSLKSSLGINVDGYKRPDRFWQQYHMDSLDGYEIFVKVSGIKYVPLGHEIKAIGTDRYFHKQKAYEDEKELRVLLQLRLGQHQRFVPLSFLSNVPSPRNAVETDCLILYFAEYIKKSHVKHDSILNGKLSESGVRCPIDINSLIKEIVVSPFLEDSIVSEIESLNHKFGVSAEVKRSAIVNETSPTMFELGFPASEKVFKFEL